MKLQLLKRRKPEESSVKQLGYFIALDSQDGERGKAVESEPFDRSQTVSVQFSVKVKQTISFTRFQLLGNYLQATQSRQTLEQLLRNRRDPITV